MSLTKAPCEHIGAPTELSYFTTGYTAVLCVITITGNVLVCLAVYKDPHKKLRTPFMYILVNLAVTDLVVGLITLPVIVATHALEAINQKKESHTIIARTTYFISKTASILNLTAFCVDRFIAVNWPIKYRRMLNTRVCIILFAVIWVLAGCLSCIYYAVGFMDFIIAFAQISFILVLVISVVTFRLLKTLSNYSRERKSIASISELHKKSDRRVTKLFSTMLVMFFVCYTPAIICMYLIKFCTNCDCTFRHVIRDLQFLFICSNSAINPFLCTIRLKPFRDALSMIFHVKTQFVDEDDEEDSPQTLSTAIRRFSRRLSSMFTTVEDDEGGSPTDTLIKLQTMNENGTTKRDSIVSLLKLKTLKDNEMMEGIKETNSTGLALPNTEDTNASSKELNNQHDGNDRANGHLELPTENRNGSLTKRAGNSTSHENT